VVDLDHRAWLPMVKVNGVVAECSAAHRADKARDTRSGHRA
jgi:hypothetical protein